MTDSVRGVLLVGGLGVLVAVFASCVPEALSPLPPVDRARFAQCSEPMAERTCPGGGCADQMADAYARLPNSRARQEYLVSNGCPERVAEYSAPRSSGGEGPGAASAAAVPPAAQPAPLATISPSAPSTDGLFQQPSDGDAGAPGAIGSGEDSGVR